MSSFPSPPPNQSPPSSIPTASPTASASAASGPLNAPSSASVVADDWFYSVLVHNISHHDELFSILPKRHSMPPATHSPKSAASNAPAAPAAIIGRPKFNKYKALTARFLKELLERPESELSAAEFPSTHYGPTLPYGWNFLEPRPVLASWDGIRTKSAVSLADYPDRPEVLGVYFPILATLIPRWLHISQAKVANLSPPLVHSHYLYLVSGSGTPWDSNLDSSGNSTKCTAKLAQIFIERFYPQIKVIHIHSPAGIFHYDANVQFVNKELKPRVEMLRHELAEKFYEKWVKKVHLTISLTDGASARVAAINASLRHFKPDCLHYWQLKSFWHEFPLITGRGESDVEFHEFEKLEMTPPTLVSDTDKDTRALVREMIAHKQNFESVRDSPRYNELSSFWLRKSKQPVLSVLMIKKKSGPTKFYRGVNVEVSMPTGSLCAERNAIGSALALDPTIVRKDMKMIAVLAMPLTKPEDKDKDKETIKEEALNAPSEAPQLLRKNTRSTSMTRNTSQSSAAIPKSVQHSNGTPLLAVSPSPEPFSPHSPPFKRRNEDNESLATSAVTLASPLNAASMPNPSPAKRGRVTPSMPPASTISLPPPPAEAANTVTMQPPALTRIPSLAGPPAASLSIFSPSDSPPRDLTELERTRSKTREKEKEVAAMTDLPEAEAQPPRSLTPAELLEEERKKQKLLEQELLMMKIRNEQKIGPDEGRNPINPCGACNEWLKKIAEVNPDFKVITFTSLDCSTVFIKPVKF